MDSVRKVLFRVMIFIKTAYRKIGIRRLGSIKDFFKKKTAKIISK